MSKICSDIFDIDNEGNYVGSIDNFITEKTYNENSILTLIKLINGRIYNCCEFINEFPLIIDQLKKYLFVFDNRYNLVDIDNKKYFIYRNENEISLKEYLEGKANSIFLKDLVKKIIIFDWLMYVNDKNLHERIRVKSMIKHLTNIKGCRSVILTLNPENTHKNFDIENTTDFPKKLIKDWFDNKIENFYLECKESLRGIEYDYFKDDIMRLIKKYENDSYIYWMNFVLERFRFIKSL